MDEDALDQAIEALLQGRPLWSADPTLLLARRVRGALSSRWPEDEEAFRKTLLPAALRPRRHRPALALASVLSLAGLAAGALALPWTLPRVQTSPPRGALAIPAANALPSRVPLANAALSFARLRLLSARIAKTRPPALVLRFRLPKGSAPPPHPTSALVREVRAKKWHVLSLTVQRTSPRILVVRVAAPPPGHLYQVLLPGIGSFLLHLPASH